VNQISVISRVTVT